VPAGQEGNRSEGGWLARWLIDDCEQVLTLPGAFSLLRTSVLYVHVQGEHGSDASISCFFLLYVADTLLCGRSFRLFSFIRPSSAPASLSAAPATAWSTIGWKRSDEDPSSNMRQCQSTSIHTYICSTLKRVPSCASLKSLVCGSAFALVRACPNVKPYLNAEWSKPNVDCSGRFKPKIVRNGQLVPQESEDGQWDCEYAHTLLELMYHPQVRQGTRRG
jgi:hypothetical protein